MTLRFAVGEVAIYVGGGANYTTFAGQPISPIPELLLKPGDEVTIIKPSISRVDGSRSYIVDFKGRIGEHNVREMYLRKRPSDYTDTDHYAQIFRRDLIQGEVGEKA